MFYPNTELGWLKLNVYLQSAITYLVIKSLKCEKKWLCWDKSQMLSQRWVVLLHVMTLVENTDGHWANPWSSTNKFSMFFAAEAPLLSCFCIVGGSHRMPTRVGINMKDDPHWMFQFTFSLTVNEESIFSTSLETFAICVPFDDGHSWHVWRDIS